MLNVPSGLPVLNTDIIPLSTEGGAFPSHSKHLSSASTTLEAAVASATPPADDPDALRVLKFSESSQILATFLRSLDAPSLARSI